MRRYRLTPFAIVLLAPLRLAAQADHGQPSVPPAAPAPPSSAPSAPGTPPAPSAVRPGAGPSPEQTPPNAPPPGVAPATDGSATGPAETPAPANAAPVAAPSMPAGSAPTTAPTGADGLPGSSAPPGQITPAAPASAPPIPPPAPPATAWSASTTNSPVANRAGESGGANAQPPPDQSLGVELFAGASVRLDGKDPAYREREAVDVSFGLGAWWGVTRQLALGAAFQRTGLGAELTPSDEESASVQRDADSVWIAGRLYPYQVGKLRLFAELDAGLTWQRASATGTHAGDFVRPPTVFACSASAGPSAAFGAGGGVDVDVDRRLGFVASLNAATHRTSSDVMDGCVAGAGPVTTGALRLGFVYRFGLD